MEQKTITRVVWQYSETLPAETMEFLWGIAEDYGKVKNYVYARYSGIGSVDKLTPVYDILNEMRKAGLRERLQLPVVYYELAAADAVADIKGMWGVLKNRLRACINANENLSDKDRMYIRTVLKMNSVFAAVLNRREYEMPSVVKGLDVDTVRLNNLIRRLVRRYRSVPRAKKTDSFRVTPAGYRYGDGGIYLVSRVPRRRVFLPLKGTRTADRQIQVCLREDSAAIAVPMETEVRRHVDYRNTIYVHIGFKDMFTLSNGNVYGENLQARVNPETERLNQKNRERGKLRQLCENSIKTGDGRKAQRLRVNNLGKKKYRAQKQREWEKTGNFINAELNRLLREERPAKIVITRPVTKNRTRYYSRSLNRQYTRSFRGYIRERIAYKCRLHGIELVELYSKGTGGVCAACGAEGKRQVQEFICESCGLRVPVALNTAKNIEKLYQRVNLADAENKWPTGDLNGLPYHRGGS